jgi:hypothetical protein
MTDFDSIQQIKKNLLEELLRDSKELNVDIKSVIESRLKVINDNTQKSIEDMLQYKSFVESVKKNLNFDNFYIKEYEPERDTYEEVEDEDGRRHYPYRMSDEEALERAIQDLLENRESFEEFITGYIPEYVDLLRVIVARETKTVILNI